MDLYAKVFPGLLLYQHHHMARKLGDVVVVVNIWLALLGLVIDWANHGAIIPVPGHVHANVNAPGGFRDMHGTAGLLCPLHGDEAVREALGEVPGHTHPEHVAVLAEHLNDFLDKGRINPTALPSVNMEGAVLRPVLVVAVEKKAGQLCGVPGHKQAGALCGEGAQDRLKHLVVNAAGLVDDIKHMVSVKAL